MNTRTGMTAAMGPLVSTPRPTHVHQHEKQAPPRWIALGKHEEQQRQRHHGRDGHVDEDAAAEHEEAGPAASPTAARSGASGWADADRAMNHTAISMTTAAPVIAARSTASETPKTRYRPATIQ